MRAQEFALVGQRVLIAQLPRGWIFLVAPRVVPSQAPCAIHGDVGMCMLRMITHVGPTSDAARLLTPGAVFRGLASLLLGSSSSLESGGMHVC